MKAVARDAQPHNLAGLPSVDRILGLAGTKALVERYGREPVVNAMRELLQSVRAGRASARTGTRLRRRFRHLLEKKSRPRLRRVINLTGTVLHTNLGRALLPEEAVRAAALAMTQRRATSSTTSIPAAAATATTWWRICCAS